ncbi:MAG: VWA domain-containing protein [Bacteroidales bacterium]|nr:VWA domain-containing protein [Bacteroidales bacterium]
MTFANPGFLFFLVLIPALVAWYFYRQKRNNADLQVSSTEGFETSSHSYRHYLYHGLYILRLLAITLLIVALARPQTSLSRQDISVEGIDLVIALDISGSMTAMDFKPDRLEAAKDVAIEFIGGRPNDRIGLVIFSGETFTQCPLTTDHAVLKNLFHDIHSGMIDDGTALGDGLATAVNRLRGSKAISKVIILLTDGVSNTGAVDPRSAAEIAKLYGIRIYTIGIGTMGQAPIPVQTPFGIQTQMMDVKIDEPLLMEIARMTDGKYFRATNNAKLRAIYQEIDKMEKSKIDVTEFRKKNEKFLSLALISFIFISLETLLRYVFLKNIP